MLCTKRKEKEKKNIHHVFYVFLFAEDFTNLKYKCNSDLGMSKSRTFPKFINSFRSSELASYWVETLRFERRPRLSVPADHQIARGRLSSPIFHFSRNPLALCRSTNNPPSLHFSRSSITFPAGAGCTRPQSSVGEVGCKLKKEEEGFGFFFSGLL